MLRDHLISHLLAALSDAAIDSVIFFGGTALARSVIPDGPLSEDVDLQERWERDLGGQIRLTVTAAEAVSLVRDHWSRLMS